MTDRPIIRVYVHENGRPDTSPVELVTTNGIIELPNVIAVSTKIRGDAIQTVTVEFAARLEQVVVHKRTSDPK